MIIRELFRETYDHESVDVIAHVLGKDKTWVLMHYDKVLSTGQVGKIRSMIKQHKAGKPLAYLFGYKYFFGLRFKVSKDALIPRPETELLVELALNHVESKKSKVQSILDVGTGSGCIIVSLADNLHSRQDRKRYKFYASDASKPALTIANQNAKIHKTQVKFIKSDLLKNTNQGFDLIVANLPYLDKKWQTDSIKLEPPLALYTSKKGLALIEKLLLQIGKLKKQPRYVLLEFDPRQKSDLSKLIKKLWSKAKIKFYKDLNNWWRCVVIEIHGS